MSEVNFAQGDEVGNQNIRIAYENLNPMEPESRFPMIYKMQEDGSVKALNLTPDEGRFVAQKLSEMFHK